MEIDIRSHCGPSDVQQLEGTVNGGFVSIEVSTHEGWNHGPVIGAKCTGIKSHAESPKNDQAGDNTKHDTGNSDRVHLVGVIDHRRRR